MIYRPRQPAPIPSGRLTCRELAAFFLSIMGISLGIGVVAWRLFF